MWLAKTRIYPTSQVPKVSFSIHAEPHLGCTTFQPRHNIDFDTNAPSIDKLLHNYEIRKQFAPTC
jgi:hypothetical protein